jgi:hypothetical protein
VSKIELMPSENAQTILQALTALVVDPELEELEARLDPFNIFEAIGMTTQEIRHSNFLAFLLNPKQNHGLGNTFLKRFLQKALMEGSSAKAPITPIDVNVWSFDDLVVHREHLNIDILLVSEDHQLAIIIENKIASGEHSGQLARYYSLIKTHYPNCNKIVGMYLTPEGNEPSDEENYFAVSYGVVLELIEDLVKNRASNLGVDVVTILRHYAHMLRRNVVNESEIAELCRRIYSTHQKALDLIYEFRLDLQSSIQGLLETLVRADTALILDSSTKSSIRFGLQDWETPILKSGKGWTRSGRILLFEFYNRPGVLGLLLYIGPGPQQIRQRLYDTAGERGAPFKRSSAFGSQWNRIYSRPFLNGRDYDSPTFEEITAKIKEQWQRFIATDLPLIKAAISEEQWIWQPDNTTESLLPRP